MSFTPGAGHPPALLYSSSASSQGNSDMSRCQQVVPRLSTTRVVAVVVLLTSTLGSAPVRAQTDLEAVRLEMESSMGRLGEIDMGLFRITMQDPNLEQHVSLVTTLIQSVITDLDYLEALIELHGLANDIDAATAIVLRELTGAEERLQLGAFEQHVASETNSNAAPRALQLAEQQVLEELRQVVDLYARTSDLIDPALP